MLDDEDLLYEISESLEVTGLRLTSAQVQMLLEDEDELIEQLEEWGADDGELMEQVANLLSQELLEEDWPTFGQKFAGYDVDDFHVRFLAAARTRGYTLLEEAAPPAS